MKKILIAILCMLMCLAAFAGCKLMKDPQPLQDSTPAIEQPQQSETTPEIAQETEPEAAPSTVPATPWTPPATPPGDAQTSSPATAPAATPALESYPFSEANFPRIDGSTATIPLIEAVTSALLGMPRSETNVVVSKTNEAYIALAENDADLLLVYDGGDETRKQVNADKLFETVPIGKDALVFLVNQSNPIDNITTDQIRLIFSGVYKNWSELGGSNEPIRAYQRGVGSGSQALMEKLVMPGSAMADPARIPIIGDMGGLVEAVADFSGGPTGIGYNVYYYVTEMRSNDFIKILSIDGVYPNYDTIQSGKYPFVSEFYSVIRKSEPADSPARALHEWMLSDDAQNLMVQERYVALYANPDESIQYADDRFSFYPNGEAPEYLHGVDPYIFRADSNYGQLYFYLGAARYDEWSFGNIELYGICTAKGKIVTEPIYSVPLFLTDSKGSNAYFCYRSDKDPVKVTITYDSWSYETNRYPALLFAVDGSWIKEFDAAMPFEGNIGPVNIIMNADYLAVMQGGKWGAVDLRGNTVIPFNRDSVSDIYPPADGGFDAFGVTGDRFTRSADDEEGNTYTDLFDAGGNLVASGLRGRPQGMAGEYFVTNEWSGDAGITVYTYTLDGEFIASRVSPSDGRYVFSYASPLGEYVMIYTSKATLICDRELDILHEFWHEGAYGYYSRGPNVLLKPDYDTHFNRTFLLDGTLLMTWYDLE
ncbi:MAG: substrate-binding domain-containing protein [Oscillospiraceae bacterium]|nr:substrate-binding domain-containing protein [Oscillospiraceae bacterium]